LALEHLQFGDLSFGLPVAPYLTYGRFDRSLITAQAYSKVAEFWMFAGDGPSEPWFERCDIPPFQQPSELHGKVLSRTQGRTVLSELVYVASLLGGQSRCRQE
jgi:hypothetical protein